MEINGWSVKGSLSNERELRIGQTSANDSIVFIDLAL
jgi:hypothetical protein